MLTIETKVETSYGTLLSGLANNPNYPVLSGLSIYQGMGNLEKEAPCTIIACEGATDEAPHLPVKHVRTKVVVKSMAADSTVSGASTLAQTIFDNCFTPSGLSNSQLGLAVYDVIFTDSSESVEGDSWKQELNLDVIAVHTS